MRNDDPHRILRQLRAAEGYIELGMSEYALAELEPIETGGPFDAPLDLLRGRAFQQQGRFDEAIVALRRAANGLEPPHNRHAWLSLSECFREQGRTVVADLLEKIAHLPRELRLKLPAGVQLSIVVEAVADADEETLLAEFGESLEPDPDVADEDCDEFDVDLFADEQDLGNAHPDWN